MKTLITIFTLILSLGGLAQPSPITETDENAILGGVTESGSQLEVKLEPGLYEIGNLNGRTTHYLLLDQYINDSNKFLAVYIPKNINRTKKARGKIFQVRPMQRGTKIMLSPIFIDSTGNIRVLSQTDRDAPVLEITRRAGKHRYPYIVNARNDNDGNGIRGMKGSGKTNLSLNAHPSNGVFAAGAYEDSPDILVSGNEMTLTDDYYFDQTFKMVALNGGSGKISGLQVSELDTMSEMEISEDAISRLAVFINGCWKKEVLLVARKTVEIGVFEFSYNEILKPYLLDRLFPGRLTPRTNNN